MTPAVRLVFTRKYARAAAATARHVARMSPRGGAKSANTSPPTKADVARDPALKAAFTTGLRCGVKAFTPAWKSETNTPTPVPYKTKLAMTAANDTEIALERNRNTGMRWVTAASSTRIVNMSGSTLWKLALRAASATHARPPRPTALTYVRVAPTTGARVPMPHAPRSQSP